MGQLDMRRRRLRDLSLGYGLTALGNPCDLWFRNINNTWFLSTLFQELQEIIRHMFHDGVFMADFRYDDEIHLAAILFQNSLQTS